jgi:predicted amidohydrolase YtcJ
LKRGDSLSEVARHCCELANVIPATVLPGLIDGHGHLTDAAGSIQHQMMVALHSATESLKATYTTQVAKDRTAVGTPTWNSKKRSSRAWFRARVFCLARTAPGNTPYPLEFKPFEVEIVEDGANALR